MDTTKLAPFWQVVKQLNTRLQAWAALAAWIAVGVFTFLRLTQPMPDGTLNPTQLALLNPLWLTWAGGFVSIIATSAVKSYKDRAKLLDKTGQDGTGALPKPGA